jgi:hypothetical protein
VRGVEFGFSRPGRPTDNAFIASLNGKFRAECQSAHWFLTLAAPQQKCERWRKVYNAPTKRRRRGRNARRNTQAIPAFLELEQPRATHVVPLCISDHSKADDDQRNLLLRIVRLLSQRTDSTS